MTRTKNSSQSPRAIADSKQNGLKQPSLANITALGRTRLCLLAFSIVVLGTSSGCFKASYQHSGSGFLFHHLVEAPVAHWRDKVWAERAFNLHYPNCGNEFPADFRSGFIEGYCNACNGGNGIPPALPPKAYWTSRYKTEQGSKKVDAWFAGYPAGAKAANIDGSSDHHEIRISNELAATLYRNQEANNGAIIGSALLGANKSNETYEMPVERTLESGISTMPVSNSIQEYSAPVRMHPAPNRTYEAPAPPIQESLPPITSSDQINQNMWPTSSGETGNLKPVPVRQAPATKISIPQRSGSTPLPMGTTGSW